jgi:DNA-directed RNA polymerase subunit E'/Rpb7
MKNNLEFERNTNKLKNDYEEEKQKFLNNQKVNNFKNEINARKRIMELDFQKQQQQQMIQMMMQQMMLNNQFNK